MPWRELPHLGSGPVEATHEAPPAQFVSKGMVAVAKASKGHKEEEEEERGLPWENKKKGSALAATSPREQFLEQIHPFLFYHLKRGETEEGT